MPEVIFVTVMVITITFVGGILLANLLEFSLDGRSVVERFMIGLIVVGVVGILFFVLDGDVMMANSLAGIAILGLWVRSFMLWVKTTRAYAQVDYEKRLQSACSNPIGISDSVPANGPQLMSSCTNPGMSEGYDSRSRGIDR